MVVRPDAAAPGDGDGHVAAAGRSWSVEQPYHPIGQPDSGRRAAGLDMSIFTTDTPSYAEVLEVRAERVAMVRDFIAAATPEVLASPRTNPWDPD